LRPVPRNRQLLPHGSPHRDPSGPVQRQLLQQQQQLLQQSRWSVQRSRRSAASQRQLLPQQLPVLLLPLTEVSSSSSWTPEPRHDKWRGFLLSSSGRSYKPDALARAELADALARAALADASG